MAFVCKHGRLLMQFDFNVVKSMQSLNLRTIFTSGKKFSQWELISSVYLERTPVIARDLNDVEQRFQQLQHNIEFESSLKSDHERRKEQDKVYAERLKKGDFHDADIDQTTKATAQDFEDASQDEVAKSQLQARVSAEDRNVKSLDRKFDQHLLLLVQQKLGEKSHWLLPQQVRAEGETMRQTAERALQQSCGGNVKALFLGNAPWGFYKYKYPKAVRDKGGPVGAKVFFFKAMYQSGDIEGKNFQWLTKIEAEKSLPEDYFKSVDQFLLH